MALIQRDIQSSFLHCGILTYLTIFAVHFVLRKMGFSSEVSDKGVLISLLGVTSFFILMLHIGKSFTYNEEGFLFWLGLFLFVLLAFSVSAVTTLPGYENRLWFGYGLKIAIIGTTAVPLQILLFYSKNIRFERLISIIVFCSLSVLYIPSILQPPWGVVDWYHSIYIVNELLGPQNGAFPTVNFSSQYTSILGYLFNFLFLSKGTIDQAVWFLTLLAVFTILAAMLPLCFSFPVDKRYLAFLFVIPGVFIVKEHEDAYSGSLSVLFSALPIRLLFPALIALFISFGYKFINRAYFPMVLGLICSFAIFNNFESGVVSTISVCGIFLCLKPACLALRQIFLLGASILTIFTSATCLLTGKHGGIDLLALTDFVGGFGSGFGAHPMPEFGLWLFVFVFLALSVVVSTSCLKRSFAELCTQADPKMICAGIISLFWGLFGMGMAPYYINRSIVSGQLQFLLFPMFISAAGLFLLVAKQTSMKPALTNFVVVIACLPGGISLASLIQSPSVHLAWDRLARTDSPVSKHYALHASELHDVIKEINNLVSQPNIGMISNYGFIYSNILNIKNYLPINNIADSTIVRRPLLDHMFKEIDENKVQFLVCHEPNQIIRNAILAHQFAPCFTRNNIEVYIKK